MTVTGANPLLRTERIGRWPLGRRITAEPGTALVFQTRSEELVCPEPPFTAGDQWWRAPRVAHIVDIRPHHSSFTCKLPAKGDVLHFAAAIGFDWRVGSPVAVVRDRVINPAAICGNYLFGMARKVSRKFASTDGAGAETALDDRFGSGTMTVEPGLLVWNVGITLTMDEAQRPVAQDLELTHLKQRLAEAEAEGEARVSAIKQDADLKRQDDRAKFFTAIFHQGLPAMAGNVLAQDPSKAAEMAAFMASLWEKDQKVALEAMKVMLDGDQVRLGEVDGAVAAAVSRFTSILSSAGAQFGASSLVSGGIGGAPPEQLPSAAAGTAGGQATGEGAATTGGPATTGGAGTGEGDAPSGDGAGGAGSGGARQ